MKPVLQILALWRGRAAWLAIGLCVSLAATLCAVALMAVSGATIAAAMGGTLLALPVLLRVIGPARVVLRYLERLSTHAATFRALADLRVWFFRGLARRAAGGLGFRRAGDMLSRLVNDVEALDGLYLRILVPLAGAAMLLPILDLLIARRDPNLAGTVAALFATAAFLLPTIALRQSAALGRRLTDHGAALRVAVLDAVSGLREVRAYGAEDRMRTLIATHETALQAAQRALAEQGAAIGAIAFLCAQAAILAVLVFAGIRPGFSVVALFLTVAAFEAVGGLPRAGLLAGQAAAAARRVLEAASGPDALPDPATPGALPAGHDLSFDDIRFRWQPDRPPVFDGLSLQVPQGARVALLGPSGAGKSTLAALALRVAAPEAGRVCLGGVDLMDLPAAAVRSRIAWLGQATHLFDDTIRANLLLGRPDADDAALWAALDAAAIGEFVRGLPEGLESWVGEGGAGFSGGQGRRLALARALLSRAPVLILDEPGAGLDAKTERDFLATLFEAATGRSVILIAHRLTGVERLDRIWRLSGGHAVAAAA